MNTALFYDFETNGLPLFSEPSEDPRQPHVVQAAAVLVDVETRKTLASLDAISIPDDWGIPDDVVAIHGITSTRALMLGVPEQLIVDLLWGWGQFATVRVGHIESFDARVMRIALKRFYPGVVMRGDLVVADDWKARPTECTSKLVRPIMKLAGLDTRSFPSLANAYRFYFGEELENAHSAMGDVLGTMRLYWAIKDGLTPKGS